MDSNFKSVSTRPADFGRAVWNYVLKSHYEDCDNTNRELAKSAMLPDVTIDTLYKHIDILIRNIYILKEAKKEFEHDVNMQILDLQRQVNEARARNRNTSSHKEVAPCHSKPNLSPKTKSDLFSLPASLLTPQKTTEKVKGETTPKLDLFHTPSYLLPPKT